MGRGTSQVRVIAITDRAVTTPQNAARRDHMPILMVALVALGAFGLIGLMLLLAASLERKKTAPKEPSPDKAA
jgi:hypothetical protein